MRIDIYIWVTNKILISSSYNSKIQFNFIKKNKDTTRISGEMVVGENMTLLPQENSNTRYCILKLLSTALHVIISTNIINANVSLFGNVCANSFYVFMSN